MNFHDSERLAGLLEVEGYAQTADEKTADVIVVNTCSVRERAEDKLYSRLGEIRKGSEARPVKPLVVVAGCVAQQEGDRLFAREPAIDIVVGTQSLKRLPALLARADLVVADSVSQCVHHGECRAAMEEGLIEAGSILELGQVVKNPAIGRTSEHQITVADLTGVAVQDIQIAKMVDRARLDDRQQARTP